MVFLIFGVPFPRGQERSLTNNPPWGGVSPLAKDWFREQERSRPWLSTHCCGSLLHAARVAPVVWRKIQAQLVLTRTHRRNKAHSQMDLNPPTSKAPSEGTKSYFWFWGKPRNDFIFRPPEHPPSMIKAELWWCSVKWARSLQSTRGELRAR